MASMPVSRGSSGMVTTDETAPPLTEPTARSRERVVDTARAELHGLVDALSKEELATARRFLGFLQRGAADPFAWILDTAPEDDEPSAPDEDAGTAAAWEEYLRGDTVAAEEAPRRLVP